MLTIRNEDGSMPLAMLAAIAVAGMIVVLFTRTAQGERTTRYDRAFSENLHAADAGVNEALFRLNQGEIDKDSITIGTSTALVDKTIDGIGYRWSVRREDSRRWIVDSQATNPDGTRRRVVAEVVERPRFYNGAFGDEVISLNGTSSQTDSYSSIEECPSIPLQKCGWGPETESGYLFGTGNASLGTNENFKFQGQPVVRDGGATLYAWDDADQAAADADPPFGPRCEGLPCTVEKVLTNPRELTYGSASEMAFITERVGPGAASSMCSGAATGSNPRAQELGALVLNDGAELLPYTSAADPTWTVTDPTKLVFKNYYCADSIQVDGKKITVNSSATRPVVIFVRDYLSFKSQSQFGCHDSRSGVRLWCNDASKRTANAPSHQDGRIRPAALGLQLYFLGGSGQDDQGEGASDLSIAANAAFAGIIYAPQSICAGGNGNVDIYGSVICGSLLNVGNWAFHYDDALSGLGSRDYDIARWNEEVPS